jgi:hypothetical protein
MLVLKTQLELYVVNTGDFSMKHRTRLIDVSGGIRGQL